jgi:ATP synthase protein I
MTKHDPDKKPQGPKPPDHEQLLTPGAGSMRKAFSAGDPAAIGIEIVLAIIMGSGVGYWADGKWGTTPWLTVLGFCFGCGAAAKAVHRVIKDFERNNPDRPTETTSQGSARDETPDPPESPPR